MNNVQRHLSKHQQEHGTMPLYKKKSEKLETSLEWATIRLGLRFEPGTLRIRVSHTNHSATEALQEVNTSHKKADNRSYAISK